LKGYVPVYREKDHSAVIFPEDGGEGTLVEVPGLRIDSVVGSGANGIVFSAWDVLDRDLAIKVYPPRIDKDRDIDEVYEQATLEAQKIAYLKHPAIATLYRYGRLGDEVYGSYSYLSEGWPYCVMEMRGGQPMKDVFPKIEDDVEARRLVLRRIFDALTYAEGRGSLHGDLHEGNVLIEAFRFRGKVKIMDVSVIDFGTSVFAGRIKSEVRHARLLRKLTSQLLPELNIAFVPTSRLAHSTGLHMLPRLFAALKLHDQINPSPQCPPRLTPREIGIELAYATDFNLDVLWTALSPHLDESNIFEIKKTLLEYLTHEHSLADTHISDAGLAARLRQELQIRKVETAVILAT
jgi:serine/threonine protein kinase